MRQTYVDILVPRGVLHKYVLYFQEHAGDRSLNLSTDCGSSRGKEAATEAPRNHIRHVAAEQNQIKRPS